jgi:hypothetical protein
MVFDPSEFEEPKFDCISKLSQCFVNSFLFQRNIENILLIPEGRRARQVMDPDLRPGPPRNCREVNRYLLLN